MTYSVAVLKEQCPRCAKNGRDTKGDNLAVYTDGHKFCFGCGLYVPPKLSERLGDDYGHHLPSTSTPNQASLSDDLPYAALNWLLQYGITHEEIKEYKIQWNPDKETLVFPIYKGDVLKATNERYFGTNPKHPRYRTSGDKTFLPVFYSQETRPVCVLVEDYVSAIKVGRHYYAIPLLGSTVALGVWISLLGFHRPVRIWLDYDKAKEAIQLAAKGRQWALDCGTIITAQDPKAYTNKIIIETVNESLLSYH